MNLDEVEKMVAQLERDLARLPGGSPQVEAIQVEVKALKRALAEPEPPHHKTVRQSLESLRARLDADAASVAPYISWIGRILGLS